LARWSSVRHDGRTRDVFNPHVAQIRLTDKYTPDEPRLRLDDCGSARFINVNGPLNRQATTMAYNDAFILLLWLFVLVLPLTMLRPKTGIPIIQQIVEE
jgi:hypothetical protein